MGFLGNRFPQSTITATLRKIRRRPSSGIPGWARRCAAPGGKSSFRCASGAGAARSLWGQAAGGHAWRVSGDVFDSWISIWIPSWKTYGVGVDVSLDLAADLAEYGGPAGWNDLDMLVVGLKGKGQIGGTGMSHLEYQTHMSMWCMACSPLMIGCNVQNDGSGYRRRC